MSGHRHCRPCRAAPPFVGHFPVPPVVTDFTFRKAWRSRNVPFSCSAPQVSACGVLLSQCCLFPPGWNGSCHLWRFWASLSVVFSAGRFSPIQEPWVPGYLVSLALAIASYCFRHLQGVQLLLSLLFITPFASLVFLENFTVGVVDGVFGSGF